MPHRYPGNGIKVQRRRHSTWDEAQARRTNIVNATLFIKWGGSRYPKTSHDNNPDYRQLLEGQLRCLGHSCLQQSDCFLPIAPTHQQSLGWQWHMIQGRRKATSSFRQRTIPVGGGCPLAAEEVQRQSHERPPRWHARGCFWDPSKL